MTGMFVLPVAALLVLPEALGFSGPGHPSELLKSPLFALHTLSAVSSYCAFALAAVHGILYLMLYRELKLGRASLVFHRLPSLEQLARILIRSTTSGFVLLGLAIVIGFVWISHVRPGYYTDPKALFTLFVWLVFGAALLAHHLFRQNPTLPVYISLAGFCLLLLATLVPGHVSGSFHQFR
jgi:ABC-type uncharacterized transport system permease subunit